MFFTNCIGSCCLKERKLLVVGWVFEKIMSRVLFFLSSGYNCDGEPIHFFFFFNQRPIFQLSDFHDSNVSQLQQPPASLPNEPWTEVFISLI